MIKRTLIHGGRYAPRIKHVREHVTQSERIRMAEMKDESIIIDKHQLSVPFGDIGKLLLHCNNLTKSITCFESDIPIYAAKFPDVYSGMFNKQKFKITREGIIEWNNGKITNIIDYKQKPKDYEKTKEIVPKLETERCAKTGNESNCCTCIDDCPRST